MIHYITGGERSGKSSFAQRLAEELSESPYYLATSRILDDDFKQRIDRHIADRKASLHKNINWQTIEADRYLSQAIVDNCHDDNPCIIIDCITLWLTNFVMDFDYDIEHCLTLATQEIDKLVAIAIKKPMQLYIISNEIGMSLHAATPQGRKFVSLQGWVNQYIAQVADKATLVVSGLPVVLK